MDLGQDALDLLEVRPAAAVEAHAALAAVEQRHVEMVFERTDALGDGGRGDAELGGGAGEALETGGDLEEAQALKRGQEQHGGKPPEKLQPNAAM